MHPIRYSIRSTWHSALRHPHHPLFSPSSSKLHHALQHSSSHTYSFSYLPPLPQLYQHHLAKPEPPVSYQTLTFAFPSSAQALLPLPARISPVQPKPPLPPRPLTNSTAQPSTLHTPPNPFASLFSVGFYPPPTSSSQQQYMYVALSFPSFKF